MSWTISKTPLTDKLMEGLTLSNVGNLKYSKRRENGNYDDIILQISARSRRGNNLLEEMKRQAIDLREKIVDNLRENIKDQMQDNTIVDYSSLFDLNVVSSLENRIQNLEKLCNVLL